MIDDAYNGQIMISIDNSSFRTERTVAAEIAGLYELTFTRLLDFTDGAPLAKQRYEL